MVSLLRRAGWLAGLLFAAGGFLTAPLCAEVLRLTVNGRIAAPLGTSIATGGSFAGASGPFTASFEYDPNDPAWRGGGLPGVDQVNYSMPINGVITFDGKSYGSNGFYKFIGYSSLDFAQSPRSQGQATIRLAYNFVQPDTGKSYYSNFSVFGPANDFFVQGKSKLFISGSTINQFSSSYLTGSSYGYFGDFGISSPGIENFVSYIPESITVSSVPEPTSWLLMILGMGVVGGMMRRRKDQGRLAYPL